LANNGVNAERFAKLAALVLPLAPGNKELPDKECAPDKQATNLINMSYKTARFSFRLGVACCATFATTSLWVMATSIAICRSMAAANAY